MKILRKTPIILMLIGLFLVFQADRIQASYDTSNRAVVNSNVKPNLSSAGDKYSDISPQRDTSTGCHFGVAVTHGLKGYDLSALGVGHYLDWGSKRNTTVAGIIDYFPVINVSDKAYSDELQSLKTNLDSKTMPGATWIIGNEPDSQVDYQDHISAESYANRFFEMATLIRTKDPSAKIAFGTIIQPTPVRIRYLDKVITRLVIRANGNKANALALIDIYSIHAFILNEQPLYDSAGKVISWGAGVPVGYGSDWPAYQVINGDQTHDINIFKGRIVAFRQWMNNLGPLEQAKPLWITEYGSLFPTTLNVSESTTATFMEQGFDYMLGTKLPSLGQKADAYRLVQKWVWYSFNDQLTHFGGSLYDPTNLKLTTVGEHFINYDPSVSAVPPVNSDAYVLSDPPLIVPSPRGPSYYRIKIAAGNLVSTDRLTEVRVDLYLSGNLIGSGTVKLPRCAGTARASIDVNNLVLGNAYVFTARVTVIGGNGADTNPPNNEFTFPPITMPTFLKILLPLVAK